MWYTMWILRSIPILTKIGVWGMGVNKLYPQASDVDYYEGE